MELGELDWGSHGCRWGGGGRDHDFAENCMGKQTFTELRPPAVTGLEEQVRKVIRRHWLWIQRGGKGKEEGGWMWVASSKYAKIDEG